ncbi:porin [Thiohalorhabdus methylotrophus]|uniref:Porin n=1 Tax=Thiohalorhabdus methylotrophus TaxID=3242694 RepID=A0ABV4TSE0_9GAMM
MKKKRILQGAALLPGLVAAPAMAGGAIDIDGESRLNLGLSLQAHYLRNDSDLEADPANENRFTVRRARFRLGMQVTEEVGAFLQTEYGTTEGGVGAEMRLIDAFIRYTPHPWARFYVGENMAPTTRQHLTGHGSMLAFDRPAIINKELAWGSKAKTALQNSTLPGTDAGLGTSAGVRDKGVTLFGSGPLIGALSAKYYLGAYEGSKYRVEDEERFSGRVQVNLGDPEPGYYEGSTYLGRKRTVALGAAFDRQRGVAADAAGDPVDYAAYTVDLFLEQPLGPGSLSAETAWQSMELDGTTGFLWEADDGLPQVRLDDDAVTAEQAAGEGFYVQAGYFVQQGDRESRGWQPWALYEEWTSEADGDAGSFTSYRYGLTYFIKGSRANIKAGYEVTEPRAKGADTITTAGLGFFVFY